jgi:lysophospholipase L1-like esterase
MPARTLGYRILALALWLAAGLLLLAGFEIHLRLSRTRVVRPGAGALPAAVARDAESFIEYTPAGRRLIPGSRVLIKNHRISGRDVLMEVNSLGFRDDELPEKKGPDELRVLVLGDSITWGDYLPREETFVEIAESFLRDLLPSRRVSVINAGVGDIGLKEEIDILEERGLRARPDLVVVAFYLNDSRPSWGFPGELGSPGWLRRHSVLAETIYANLKLRRFIREQGEERLGWTEEMNDLSWMNNRDQFLRLAARARFDWGAAWEEDSWERVGRELDRLKYISERNGFRTAIVAFPNALQVYAGYLENRPQRKIKELAAARGFAFLDLLPPLREFQQKEKNIYFDWCHPTAKTNSIIGDILSSSIVQTMKKDKI